MGLPMLTSATFRKLASLREKHMQAITKATDKVAPSSSTDMEDESMSIGMSARLHEGIKKICEAGSGNLKPADIMSLESLMFDATVTSDDGEDKRPKTALDDILGCLQTCVDICFQAAEISGQVKEQHEAYFAQCGSVSLLTP